jgi:RNA polymerase sigma-70 factor (ECF subfamily)
MSYSSEWPTAETVERLVSDAQSGSATTVDALLTALRPPLVGFFARRLSDDAAEDLAQAALLRITRALPTIEPDRADRFIVTIACNLVRTAHTRRARDQRRWAPEELADTHEPTTTTDRHAEYEELARDVHRICAAEMSPRLQEVMLGLLRGETPVETAERLHLNPVTVRTRLMRARAILRRELRPFLDLDGVEIEKCTQLTV